MSDEENAGAAYLAALKKSTPQAAGAAAARAPILPSSGPNKWDGCSRRNATSAADEKRKSPRYRCQGSARLREIASGVSTWATFTDISLHGCYVEAMATFRVGAKLGLTMEVNGFRVECNGEAKVVYPNLGMGICFHHDVGFGSRAVARIVALLISAFGNSGCAPRSKGRANPWSRRAFDSCESGNAGYESGRRSAGGHELF